MKPDCGLVLVLGNLSSGARDNRRRVEGLVVALERRGLRTVVAWRREKWLGLLADAELMDACCCVVAAGGDGTVAAVVNARPAAPLAVLPLGTENLFARYFGFRADADALAEVIATGVPEEIDVGRTGGRDFCLLGSAGLDAEVVRRVGAWRAAGHGVKRLTHFHYVPQVVQALLRYDYPVVALEADGRQVSGAQAFVFNFPCYARGFPLAPPADVHDGMLDWVVFEGPGFWRLLSYLWAVRQGRHLGRVDVQHGRARRIRITSEQGAPVQVDGDPAGSTPVEFTVSPYRLRVMRKSMRNAECGLGS